MPAGERSCRSRIRWGLVASALMLSCPVDALAAERGQLAEARVVRSTILHGLPSASVAVGRDGRLIWADAFGLANRDEGRPATVDTAYSIASITKPMTAVAVLILAERGLIDLDAPINTYLGEAKLVARVGSAEDATVRRVLRHRAGLPLHFNYLYEDEVELPPDIEQAIRRYGILVTAPGETRQYSNFGYGLLGYVVERVSGRPYARFVEEEIFKPLAMSSSFIATGPVDAAGAAAKYTLSGESIPFYDTDHRGAAGAFASAPDLVRFGQFLIDAAAGRSTILSSKSLAVMTSDEFESGAQDEYFGLGMAVWKHRGSEIWHQSGSMPGVSAQLLISPDRSIVVAVLINKALAPDWSIANDVLGVFAPELDRRSEAIAGLRRLAGRWKGYVSVSEGQVVPIAVTFDPEGPLEIDVDGRVLPVVQTRNVEDGFFEITSLGALVTDDVPRSGDELRFKLKFRGESINGSVAVRGLPKADRLNSGLSCWVELKRTPSRK